MLYVRASAEDRKFLIGHKTNSEIYSHYHSAISSVHVQELFRDVRAIDAADMSGLSVNRLQQLPQRISLDGWQRVEQDPEVIQYTLETSQINADLRELYGSTAAALRSCDHRVPDLLAATARLKNRRRVLLRSIYKEEYQTAFAECARPQISTPSALMMTIHPEPGPNIIDDTVIGDVRDWMLQLEQEEEEAVQELGDYEAIIAEESLPNEVEIGSADQSPMTDDIMEIQPNSPTGFSVQLSQGSEFIRLHKINDRSAAPKNMSITRVRDAMISGGLTDAVLSGIMVEVFSATHRTGKYIPGEEPLLGTSICRFSRVDLSLDYHSPKTAHAAHVTVLRNAVNADHAHLEVAPVTQPGIGYRASGVRSSHS
jgi:hypothetical protein